ncbi:hypothetical protein HPS57_05660 [Prevotella sp. PINT]|uniref:KAP family P-loop NTPase fold protein n=1 Tax=Palleniella intestinalis TaxID=2736291 RepID=UPI001555333C|nr:P-loop NTPase fold protein [Palleniella intestinalis]NPD81456.1 hypothetical protein [Palleniella intestinalis]
MERSVFVREVSGEICNSDTTHFAQTFGIVAPWGYGKTSFINLMKENLQSNFSKNIETIDYSPWNLPCNISPAEHFFKILAGKFVNSDKDLYHLLKNYAAFMLGNDTNKFLDTIVPSHVHAVSYNDICNALAGYGKKIVVFIDDIDRLEGREILEVFKLMRGSANFPNLIFVVTFDKEYVITALQTVSNAMNENYIKKFFNTEYYLPSYNTNILVELAKEYAVFLSNTDYNNFIKYCTQTEHFWGNTSPIGTLITNIRELKRWINTIRIDYALIKDDVKIEDYADLTLLKIYYHAVYMSIRNEHKTYLIEENGMLVLFNEKAYEHKDDIERKIHCGSKKDFWKNSPAKEFDNIGKEKEKEYLESILSRLFKARMYGAEDRAINNPFCFDRYFYTSIQSDDIADKDFSAFCKSSLSDMKSYVDNNLENKSTALRYKIEQYHTEDSTIATNLLEVIFYAGSKMKGFFIKPDVVYEFLEYTNADIAPRKILIMELMTKNGASHFVKMILSAIDNHRMYVKYRWEELFTEKEKQELKIKMLQFAIEERADIDDVYDFFRYTMKKDGKGQAEYDKNALMLMKDICLDRPDEMLPGQVWTNSHLEEPYRWKLSDTILNMWGNNIDKMKSDLRGLPSSPIIEEFLAFIEKWESNGKTPITYDFVYLKK